MRTIKASIIVAYKSKCKKKLVTSNASNILIYRSLHGEKIILSPCNNAILSSGHYASDITTNASHVSTHKFSTQFERRNDDDIVQTNNLLPKKFLTTREDKAEKTNELLNIVPLGKMTLHDHLRQARYLLHYWANMRTESGVQKAEEILERVVAEHQDGRNRFAHVNATTYNFVIDSWSKSGSCDGPIRAQSLLSRMEERHLYAIEAGLLSLSTEENSEEDKALYPKPTTEGYNSILHAWSQSDRPEAISKAEEVISHLEGTEDDTLLPNTRSYNILMNAYANQTGEYGFAQRAEDVLLKMSQLSKNGNFNINPDTLSFNTVLKAWKNSGGGIESAKRAEDILRLMFKLNSEGHDNVKPDSISWCTVIYAYGKHFRGDNKESVNIAINEAEYLVKFFMEYSHRSPNFKVVASSIICALIDCILNSNLPNAGERAKERLDEMMQNQISQHLFDDPNLVAFLVRGFSESKDKETALKAYDMLQDMIGEVVRVKPNTTLINMVLRMLARFNEEKRAEGLYKDVKDLFRNQGFDTAPDIITFNTMANIYFRSEDPDSCRKLIDIVKEVEDANDSGELMSFNTFSHSVLINKLSRSYHNGGAEKAYKLLMKMEDHFSSGHKNCVRPDTIMYNMVLSQIAKEKSHDAADRIMQLIQQMEKMSNEGNKSVIPDTLTYTSSINAWVKSGSSDTNKKVIEILDKMEILLMDETSPVQLDTVVFETALRAFQCGEDSDEEMAKRTFQRMAMLYRNGNKLVKPSALCCNLVLKAQCMTAKQPDRIKSLFNAHDMLLKFVHRYKRGEIDFLPNKIGFNTVITSWARSGHSKAADKSQELYSTMKDLSKRGIEEMEPDCYTNASVLTILSKSRKYDAARKAQRFFDKLEPDTQDVVTYNCLLSAWARSKDKKKVRMARKILGEMVRRKKVDRISYNTFLNACAFSCRNDEINQETLALALEGYKELTASYTPNDFSFKTIVKICKTLSGSREQCDQHLKELFDNCCRDGLVGETLIQELNAYFPSNKCEKVLGHSLQGELPIEWTKKL